MLVTNCFNQKHFICFQLLPNSLIISILISLEMFTFASYIANCPFILNGQVSLGQEERIKREQALLIYKVEKVSTSNIYIFEVQHFNHTFK